MKFGDLPIGSRFRFYSRGKVLTKADKSTYTSLTGKPEKAAADAEVLPEDWPTPPDLPQEPKTSEELAREMLTRMGVPQAWKIRREMLAELIALIKANKGTK